MVDKKTDANLDGIMFGNGEFMKTECSASIPVSHPFWECCIA
jgi:hypothetical protein